MGGPRARRGVPSTRDVGVLNDNLEAGALGNFPKRIVWRWAAAKSKQRLMNFSLVSAM